MIIATKLTPARAMVLEAMFRFQDEFEPVSLFVATKLVYLLKLLGGPFDDRVSFVKSHRGPTSTALDNFFAAYTGSYLTKLNQHELNPFDFLALDYSRYPDLKNYLENELSSANQRILNCLDELMDGYKSTYTLEILTTVAFIYRQNPQWDVQQILEESKSWSPYNMDMLRPDFVKDALVHLRKYAGDAL